MTPTAHLFARPRATVASLRARPSSNPAEHDANRMAADALDPGQWAGGDAARRVDSRVPGATGRSAPHGADRMAEVLRTGGHPLDEANRALFERRFGHDFSRVRIHSDPGAAVAADRLRAAAFTTNEHIVFAASRYAPGQRRGLALLAHELAHVVQQRRATGAGSTGVQRMVIDDAPPHGTADKSPCESALVHHKDLTTGHLELPPEWTMFKNTGDCKIGVGEGPDARNLRGIDPGRILDYVPSRGAPYLLIACVGGCTGRCSVSWGPPCIA